MGKGVSSPVEDLVALILTEGRIAGLYELLHYTEDDDKERGAIARRWDDVVRALCALTMGWEGAQGQGCFVKSYHHHRHRQ